MTDLHRARMRFEKAGLAFPEVPPELAARMQARTRWRYSTPSAPTFAARSDLTRYDVGRYAADFEAAASRVQDYALLAHSSHASRSHALRYFLVTGPLGLFVSLRWGRESRPEKADAKRIRDCIWLADELVEAVKVSRRLGPGERLMVVAADGAQSRCAVLGSDLRGHLQRDGGPPKDLLMAVLDWLLCGG